MSDSDNEWPATVLASVDVLLAPATRDLCAKPNSKQLFGHDQFQGAAEAASVRAGDPVYSLPGSRGLGSQPLGVSAFNCATQETEEQLFKETRLIGIAMASAKPGINGTLVSVATTGDMMVTNHGGDHVSFGDLVYIGIPHKDVTPASFKGQPDGVKRSGVNGKLVFGIIKVAKASSDLLEREAFIKAYNNNVSGKKSDYCLCEEVAAAMKEFKEKTKPTGADAADVVEKINRLCDGGLHYRLGTAMTAAGPGERFLCKLSIK